MPCYRPLTAFQTTDGEIVFTEKKGADVVRSLSLWCGQCIGCRLERSRQWAIRCVNEAQLHKQNCFVTLTYEDLTPSNALAGSPSATIKSKAKSACREEGAISLEYDHFQRFMKRTRRRFSPARVRFYMAGEYGELFLRPHFHACLFGIDFPDKYFWSKSPGGTKIYRSPLLEQLWPHGFSTVGEVTFESAAYIARYCTKKITGPKAKDHYSLVNTETGEILQRTPEFNHMSLKPGIGATWLNQYMTDVYPHGTIVTRGIETKPPRYYDKKYKELDPDNYELMQFGRHLEAQAHIKDNTLERLKAKETVAGAKHQLLKRTIL